MQPLPINRSWKDAWRTLNAEAAKLNAILKRSSGKKASATEFRSTVPPILSGTSEHGFNCFCLKCEEQRARCDIQDKTSRANNFGLTAKQLHCCSEEIEHELRTVDRDR